MPGDNGWDYRGKEKGGSLEDVDAYRASGGSVVQQFPAQSGSDSPSSFRPPPIEEAASFIGKTPMEESVSAFPPPPPLLSNLPETAPPKEKGHRMATLPSSRTQLHPSRLLAGFRLPTMAHLRRQLAGLSSARCLAGVSHISLLRRLFRCLWDHILSCASGKPPSYRRLNTTSASPIELPASDDDGGCREEAPLAETAILPPTSTATESDADPDKVVLKVSLLGDCRIGKTSFVVKYVGEGEQGTFSQTAGLNLVDKILLVKEAKIAFRIWDVGGDSQYADHVGMACKDAAAILIMFDLTNRCTLNSVIGWYRQARRWNRAAIRVLIGTKFDDFVHLPLDVQWTIVNQARSYAHAMKASLFFSSATHNINVNKIFKFITAKFFNLPWTIERNLTLGEPIIDFS